MTDDGKATKRAVHYAKSKGRDRCGNCDYFERIESDHCLQVQGTIEIPYWCERYKRTTKGEMYSVDNGRKVDAGIHEPMLAGISPIDNVENKSDSYMLAVSEFDIDPETAAEVLGLNLPDEEDTLA